VDVTGGPNELYSAAINLARIENVAGVEDFLDLAKHVVQLAILTMQKRRATQAVGVLAG